MKKLFLIVMAYFMFILTTVTLLLVIFNITDIDITKALILVITGALGYGVTGLYLYAHKHYDDFI